MTENLKRAREKEDIARAAVDKISPLDRNTPGAYRADIRLKEAMDEVERLEGEGWSHC